MDKVTDEEKEQRIQKEYEAKMYINCSVGLHPVFTHECVRLQHGTYICKNCQTIIKEEDGPNRVP